MDLFLFGGSLGFIIRLAVNKFGGTPLTSSIEN
jgi:hypothetical protein